MEKQLSRKPWSSKNNMNYAHPEVLVDTEWMSQNPPNESRKLVEVDYDPVNGYQKGHISKMRA